MDNTRLNFLLSGLLFSLSVHAFSFISFPIDSKNKFHSQKSYGVFLVRLAFMLMSCLKVR